MELYILDRSYRRMYVLDSFESLIWTERFQEIGDFELIVKSTRDHRTILREDTYLGMSRSKRVMVIEEVEDILDEDGEKLFIKGRSFERVLQERYLMSDHGMSQPWYITTSPIGASYRIFDHVFGNPENPWAPVPQLDPKDAVPRLVSRFVQPDQFAIDDGVEEVIDWVQEKPDYLYNEIRKACLPYTLGFRIVLDGPGDDPELYFEVYSGRDLTSRQSSRDPVIFSIDFGNIEESKHYRSRREYKNTAYVYTEDGAHHFIAHRPGEAGWGAVEGARRRVLMVPAVIPDGWVGPEWEYLMRVGMDALNQENRSGYDINDGRINQNLVYEYGTDYDLGDIVEFRNRHGEQIYRHISEQIFVSDAEGERSYPTLSISKFDAELTWASYEDQGVTLDTWGDYAGNEVATWDTF